MRLRNIPDAHKIVESHPNFVPKPENSKGKWSEYFKNGNPIYIEIGSGKGQFITTLSQQNQNINYIAMEKFISVLVKLTKKIPEDDLSNLAVMHADAENLQQYFAPGELSRIYLNFSDPWPKKRHAKRRLTNIRFLKIYQTLLKNNGMIAFKTDNRELFDYSVEQFQLTGFRMENITYDLHQSAFSDGNVTTEYEERFIRKGLPICSLIAVKDGKGKKTVN